MSTLSGAQLHPSLLPADALFLFDSDIHPPLGLSCGDDTGQRYDLPSCGYDAWMRAPPSPVDAEALLDEVGVIFSTAEIVSLTCPYSTLTRVSGSSWPVLMSHDEHLPLLGRFHMDRFFKLQICAHPRSFTTQCASTSSRTPNITHSLRLVSSHTEH